MKKVVIYQDNYDPRNENENLGVILSVDKKYRFNEAGEFNPIDAQNWEQHFAEFIFHEYHDDFIKYIEKNHTNEVIEMFDNFYNQDEDYDYEKIVKLIWEYIELNVAYFPLYLYDHSGLAISTTPFSCRWDSGKLGYIYAHKDVARDYLMIEGDEWKERAETVLKAEINLLDLTLHGHTYDVRVFEDDDEIDGCLFITDDWDDIANEMNVPYELVEQAMNNINYY